MVFSLSALRRAISLERWFPGPQSIADRETPPPPDPHGEVGSERTARTYAREAAALVLIASGLYAALALASFRADPMRPGVSGANWVGPVGALFAGSLVRAVGVVAWMVPLELILFARPLLADRKPQLNVRRLSGDVVIAVILAALTHIALPAMQAFGAMPLGGAIGDLFGEVLRGLFSTVGSYLIGLTVVALILVERATFSFIELMQSLEARLRGWRESFNALRTKLEGAWSKARELERQQAEEERLAAEPVIASPEQADAIIAAFADDGFGGAPIYRKRRKPVVDDEDDDRPTIPHSERGQAPPTPPVEPPEPAAEPESESEAEPPVALEDAPTPSAPRAEVASIPTPSPIAPVLEAAATPAAPAAEEKAPKKRASKKKAVAAPAEPVVEDVVEEPAEPTPPPKPARTKRTRAKEEPEPEEPCIVDTSDAQKTAKAKGAKRDAEEGFQLPPTDLLDPIIGGNDGVDAEKLKETGRLLEKTLNDYKVEGKVQTILPGPTVTMFEVSPAPGTKVSKVAGLADDLALGLSRKVRIIAPIPGKNRIGFEVPNEKRATVSLRQLIESREFMELDANLPCVLGRDIIGRPFFADLSAMPHVIVAGATGAGKSVGLNVMLMSLLYRCSPADMRLLMIDPKVVELAPFDRIPHLLFPVVTDMKQASNALKWTVDEMERRYQLFADAGTRNITSYNRYVRRVASGEIPPPKGPETVIGLTPEGDEVEIPAAKNGIDAELPKKLPFIVVVVEEFADLMMTQGKDVEASVARLAQKARAAGIHVILATQRPSVDVITGMIKANFPTRIAYRVTQKVDSRTILDQQGAEHLLGRGDMLVKLNGTNDVVRVQCPFCSEDEVQRVTDMLRQQGEPEYDESIVRGRDEEAKADPGDAESDPLYDKAVQVVAESGKCSTSWIQRKLGIGYNRAAKIVETMERQGIVGPPNGSKPREILISAH